MQTSSDGNNQTAQNMYPYHNQPLNILISPSSIPNPNPSTLSKQLVYPAYGTYITYPIQGFSPFQTIQYPAVTPVNQLPNTQDNTALIINLDQPVAAATTQNDTEINTQTTNSQSTNVDNEQRIPTETAPTVINHIDNRHQENSSQTLSGITRNPIITQTESLKRAASNKIDKSFSTNIELEKKKVYRKINTLPTPAMRTINKPASILKSKADNVFSLKTSIPISKIDMRSINTHNDVSCSKDSPTKTVSGSDISESKPSEVKKKQTLDLETNTKNQLESKNNILKKDSKQNFFLQNNAVMHPQSIIKMPATSDNSSIQVIAESATNFSSQMVDALTRNQPNIRENSLIVTSQNHPLPNNYNIVQPVNETSNVCARTSRPLMTTRPFSDKHSADASKGIQNLQDKSNELKKKFVLVPTSHITNQFMLTIASKPTHPNSILISNGNVKDEVNCTNQVPTIQNPKECLQVTSNIPVPETNSKVVALKRLHQDNYDENDFENLITENQIYGNKIVIKEKSQPIASKNSAIPSIQHKKILQNENTAQEATSKSNLVVQPNFLYMGNVNLQPNHNFMVLNKNTMNSQLTTDEMSPGKTDAVPASNKSEFSNQTVPQNKVMVGAFRSVNPVTHPVSFIKENNATEPNKQSTVLQSLLNKSNMKICDSNSQSNIGQLVNNQIVYQVPFFLDNNSGSTRRVNIMKPTFFNSELAMLLTKPADQFLDWKNNNNNNIGITNKHLGQENTTKPAEQMEDQIRNTMHVQISERIDSEDVVSSIDLAEKRKRSREKRKVLARELQSRSDNANNFLATTEKENICNNSKENERFLGCHYFYSDEDTDSQSDEEVKTTNKLRSIKPTIPLDTGQGKLEFLNAFGLTTNKERSEKELDRLERSLRSDSVNSACVTAVLERLPKKIENIDSVIYGAQPISLPVPKITDNSINMENIDKITDKIVFFNELKLGMVSQKYKLEHEKMWHNVLKDRKKRNGPSALIEYFEKTFEAQNIPEIKNVHHDSSIDRHTRGQLEIMTKIKESVKQNNNLIKEKLDNIYKKDNNDFGNEGNEIPLLAERNFSEISKLSNMANKSLNFLGIQQISLESVYNSNEMQQTPPVHRENIRDNFQIVPQLSIPSVTKIISLKSTQDYNPVDISPATSMDEPRNSAAGICGEDVYENPGHEVTTVTSLHEMDCDERARGFLNYSAPEASPILFPWPGIEAVLSSYRRYNDDCEAERNRLYSENDRLKREIRAKEGVAGQLSNQMRILLMEQQICEDQRKSIQRSLDVINKCIKKTVMSYSVVLDSC